MSAIEALKSACKVATSFKSFREIEIGVYDIEEFKFIETKFGKKLVVRTPEFLCFLPDRCSRIITRDEQLAELNTVGVWAMKYDGRDPRRGNCILVDIVPQQSNQQNWEWNDFLTTGTSNSQQGSK